MHFFMKERRKIKGDRKKKGRRRVELISRENTKLRIVKVSHERVTRCDSEEDTLSKRSGGERQTEMREATSVEATALGPWRGWYRG